MKDRQVLSRSGTGHIPVVSPCLHIVSMTGLVFLRSSFGYVYLRPKSLFLALCWAQLLFAIYAWSEPEAWARYGGEVVFGLSACALYFLHLSLAVTGQMRKTGPHDQHSGTSHFLRLAKPTSTDSFELPVHLGVEPGLLLLAAAVTWFLLNQWTISLWLLVAAPCLALKEVINYWYRLRIGKRHSDIFVDAEERIRVPDSRSAPVVSGKSARKKRVRRERSAAAESSADEARFAQILRMSRPYNFEKAHENYRTLIKECHPDVHPDSEEHTNHARALNEALHYFRTRPSN